MIEKEIDVLQKENMQLKKQNKEIKQTMGRVQAEKSQLDDILNALFTEQDDSQLVAIVAESTT